jgi:hypothetical protein
MRASRSRTPPERLRPEQAQFARCVFVQQWQCGYRGTSTCNRFKTNILFRNPANMCQGDLKTVQSYAHRLLAGARATGCGTHQA